MAILITFITTINKACTKTSINSSICFFKFRMLSINTCVNDVDCCSVPSVIRIRENRLARNLGTLRTADQTPISRTVLFSKNVGNVAGFDNIDFRHSAHHLNQLIIHLCSITEAVLVHNRVMG